MTEGTNPARRRFLLSLGLTAAGAGLAVRGGSATLAEARSGFFRRHYRDMTRAEIDATLARIERRAERDYGAAIHCRDTAAQPGVIFGYALNISKCRGYRDCVRACFEENNLDRDTRYIRVLELPAGRLDLNAGDHTYDPVGVPRPGRDYLPLQCMQCDNPPCVRACPVQATWQEPDGVVVIDYDWCIGCRYCMAACPYQARRFNWARPQLTSRELNPDTHYLGNRPRPRGVVEKCHFCLQRTRAGRLPACQEACPTGARIFGNLLDPHSELRYVLQHKAVLRLKEDLGTEPKFWYFRDR